MDNNTYDDFKNNQRLISYMGYKYWLESKLMDMNVQRYNNAHHAYKQLLQESIHDNNEFGMFYYQSILRKLEELNGDKRTFLYFPYKDINNSKDLDLIHVLKGEELEKITKETKQIVKDADKREQENLYWRIMSGY